MIDIKKLEQKFADFFANTSHEDFEAWLEQKIKPMTNAKPWMDEIMVEDLWDKFSQSMLTEEGVQSVLDRREFTRLTTSIRDLAADHYEPLLEAKEKEVDEWKHIAFDYKLKWGDANNENATLKAEVERLNVIKRQFEEKHIHGQYIVGKDTFENIKSISDELTRIRSSAKDNAIKFAEWVYKEGMVFNYGGWYRPDGLRVSDDFTTSELYEEWERNNKA